jgi:hypothetical protein
MSLEVVDHDPQHGPCRLLTQGGGHLVGQGRFACRGVAIDPHASRMIQPQRENPIGQPAEHLLPCRGHRRDDARG